ITDITDDPIVDWNRVLAITRFRTAKLRGSRGIETLTEGGSGGWRIGGGWGLRRRTYYNGWSVDLSFWRRRGQRPDFRGGTGLRGGPVLAGGAVFVVAGAAPAIEPSVSPAGCAC